MSEKESVTARCPKENPEELYSTVGVILAGVTCAEQVIATRVFSGAGWMEEE